MAKKRSDKTSSSNIIDLKKILFDLEKDILAVKKQIAIEDSKSADYLEKMAKLDAIRSKNRNEYFRIKRQIEKIEKDSIKRQQQEEKIQENLNKKIEEENAELQKIAEKQAKILKDARENQKIKEKELKYEKEIGVLQEKSSILMRSMNENALKNAEALKISGQFVTQIADKSEDIKKMFKGTTEETEAFDKTLQETIKNASGIDSLSAKIVENMEDMKRKGYEIVDTYQLEKDLKEQSVRLSLHEKKIGSERYNIQKKLLDSQMKELAKLKEINKQLAEKSKNSKAVRESMVGWITAVPGGAFLMNKMGLGKILTESKSIREVIKGWGIAAKSFAAALPFAALAGFFSLLIKVVKFGIDMVFELDKKISNLSKTFSVSRSAATGMFGSLGGMALQLNLIGVNVEQLSQTLEDLTEDYGIAIERLQISTTKSGWLQGITILREKYRLTNEEAVNFGKTAAAQNMTMDQLAYNAIRMSKGILNTRQAFKAIANVPMVIAVGMKNAVQDLIKFVTKAKAMGIDIKGFQEGLKGMMDIESSLENQMTAEVLTGFQFKNIDRVRELANVIGGEAEAFDLIMQDLGRITDLNQLGGKVQVEAVSKAYGFSEQQFYEMFNRQQELVKVFGKNNPLASLSKMMDMNGEELRKAAKSAKTAAQQDFLLKEARKKEGASIEEKIDDKKEKIQIEMMEKLLPTVDKLHKLVDSVLNSGELKKVVETIATSLPIVFDGMINMANKMVAAFEKVKNMVIEIREMLVSLGVVDKVEKKGPLKPGEDKYDYKMHEFFGEGSGWMTALGLGGATYGAYKGGKALIKKGVKKGSGAIMDKIKNIRKPQSPTSITTPEIKPDMPKTNLVDDILKPTDITKQSVGIKSTSMPSGYTTTSSGLYVADTPKPKPPQGIFGKTTEFFRGQWNKVTSSIDDAVMLSRRLNTKLSGFADDTMRWSKNAGSKVGGFADDAMKWGKNAGSKIGGFADDAVRWSKNAGLKMEGAGSKIGNFADDAIRWSKNAGSKIGTVADDLLKFSKGIPGLSKAFSIFGKAGIPLQVGLSAFDAFSGYKNAAKTFNKKEDQLSMREKVTSALGGVLSGVTAGGLFGMIPQLATQESAARSMSEFQKNNPILSKFVGGVYGWLPGLFSDKSPDKNSMKLGEGTKSLSEKLQYANQQREATKQKSMQQFNAGGGSWFDNTWNSMFGSGQKQQPIKTTAPQSYQTTRPVSDQRPVVVNVNTSALEQKIEKLSSIISNMASQPTYIKIGEQTVEAIRNEINWKKQNIIGVDNRYSGGARD